MSRGRFHNNYTIVPELEAIRGQSSAHSFATGPVIADPFISPFSFTMTPALSSNTMTVPSFLLQPFRCRTTTPSMTFFRSSGFPFLTLQTIISPTAAAGRRFRRPLYPLTEIMKRFLAPELSQQLITAAVGNPRLIRNLLPPPAPRPLFDILLCV